MAYIDALNGETLLDNVSDPDVADVHSVFRIEGAEVSSITPIDGLIPMPLTSGFIATGTVFVDISTGQVFRDDQDPNIPEGDFTFSVTDGSAESNTEVCSILNTMIATDVPDKPNPFILASVGAGAFDLTMPADPNDNNSPMISRPAIVMPKSEFDGQIWDGSYYWFDDMVPGETRTFDASNYPGISVEGNHVAFWRGKNAVGTGPESDNVDIPLTMVANAPTIAVEPSFIGTPYVVGDVVNVDIGTATGDNAVTPIIDFFQKNGSNIPSVTVANPTWQSVAPNGVLQFRVKWTDDVTGEVAFSQVISTSLSAQVGTMSILDLVKNNYVTSGRNSGAPLIPVTPQNHPAGVTFDQSAKGVPLMIINGQGVTFLNRSVTGYNILIRADDFSAQDCVFNEGVFPDGTTSGHIMDAFPGIDRTIVESCDFIGNIATSGLTRGVSSAFKYRQNIGTGHELRGCRFKYLGQDGVKPAGGLLMEENAFHSFSNIPTLAGNASPPIFPKLTYLLRIPTIHPQYSAGTCLYAIINTQYWTFQITLHLWASIRLCRL